MQTAPWHADARERDIDALGREAARQFILLQRLPTQPVGFLEAILGRVDILTCSGTLLGR